MGVWARGLVLVSGLLVAGCETTTYQTFPVEEGDYIRLEIASGYAAPMLGTAVEWRIYPNDLIVTRHYLRRGNFFSEETVSGVWKAARGIFNDSVIAELQAYRDEHPECRRFATDLVMCEGTSDSRFHNIVASIEGGDVDFSAEANRRTSAFGFGELLHPVFSRLRSLIP